MEPAIVLHHLHKVFQVPTPPPEGSVWRRLRHFLTAPAQPKTAVAGVSFEVGRGEIIGLLGANGSGKSTTVKMLTGILCPTSGKAEVLGMDPWRQRAAYVRRIGLVMGQKSLLWWNIPVIESLRLYRDIYGIGPGAFKDRVAYLCDMLDLGDLLHVPVRKLSLGQRMRAEITASLLHRPDILFLDEPTIGLDVLGRRKLKQFLQLVNHAEHTTMVLTSHNMTDVEDLCRRCLIMDKGRLVYNGGIAALKQQNGGKVLEVEIEEVLDEDALEALLARTTMLRREGAHLTLQVPEHTSVAVIDRLLACTRPAHLNVLPPSLEHVIGTLMETPDEVARV